MEDSPPIPKQTVGRTFAVAISLLGAVALLQLAALGYAFFRQVKIDTDGSAPGEAVAALDPGPDVIPDSLLASLDRQVPGTPPAAPGVDAAAVPPLAPLPDLPVATPSAETRISGLVKQAREMREKGDMQAALVKLREAGTVKPDDALVASELGATYEAMGLFDKAREQWQRIYEMGAAAGALQDLATLRLSGGGKSAGASPGAATLPGRDAEGLQPGSVIGLIDVRPLDQNDPAAKKKLSLKIGLKARQGERIDVRDVIIQVFFYDMVDNQHIVQTNANVSSQWTTLPADWTDDGIEILEVGYLQPKPAPGEVAEERAYLGYIVRVYYKDQLEDVRADPVKLLTLFPPPLQMEN